MPDSPAQEDPDDPTPARRGLLVLLGVIVMVVVALDQATKVWALATLEPGVRTPVLGDWFGLQLIRNPGAALSIATGMTWVLTLVAVGVVVTVLRVAPRIRSTLWAVTLGLLLGGALGNLADRLFRAPGIGTGHVVDFLAYGTWFIGNVADIAIVAAAMLLVLLVVRGVPLTGTETSGDEPGTEPARDEPGPATGGSAQDG